MVARAGTMEMRCLGEGESAWDEVAEGRKSVWEGDGQAGEEASCIE